MFDDLQMPISEVKISGAQE